MPSSLVWLRAAAVATLAAQVAGQAKCYYPNGNEAPNTEKPCSSAEGSACCPDKWQCLDNGLCHYPADNLYGRYSCTDQQWNSPGCPSNMCTYDMTAGGGESIKQCSNHNNDWCCNGDDTNVKCCQESPSPRPFFALQDGNAYATVGSNEASAVPTLSSITGLVSGTGSGNSRPSATAGTSNGATPTGSNTGANTATVDSVSTTATPFTSTRESVSSGPGGVATLTITSVITPTADANTGGTSSSSGSSSNLGLIIGCAVGIPLALALIGILFWLLRKRRNQKAYKQTHETDSDLPAASGPLGGAAVAAPFAKKEFRQSRPGTAEIDGNPIGATRPVSNVNGHAELESGTGFQPGGQRPYAPDTVGLGGGSGTARDTWGSVPPQYSPAHNQTAFAGAGPGAQELDGTSVLPAVSEKPEQYVAYKPPNPVAELPTVKTPPEDVEKQMHR